MNQKVSQKEKVNIPMSPVMLAKAIQNLTLVWKLCENDADAAKVTRWAISRLNEMMQARLLQDTLDYVDLTQEPVPDVELTSTEPSKKRTQASSQVSESCLPMPSVSSFKKPREK